jgi:diguanylate cyclase
MSAGEAGTLVGAIVAYAALTSLAGSRFGSPGLLAALALVVLAAQLGGQRSALLAWVYVIGLEGLMMLGAPELRPTPAAVALWTSSVFLVALVLGHVNDRLREERKGRRDAERSAQFLKTHDPTTSLASRAEMEDRLEREMARASRGGSNVLLLVVNLDRFKIINDAIGREAGNEVLREVANRIRGSLRGSDTVSRLGGDEFVALVPTAGTPETALKLAQKIVESLDPPMLIDAEKIHVTASVGMARFPDHGRDGSALINNAEIALRRAKARGRRSVEMFDASMRTPAADRIALERDLRQAVERGQLELHYQPQFNVASTRVAGVEALLRWRHAERGFVSPAEFVPLAEDIGLIVRIGQWALETACKQGRAWHDQGFQVRVALNMSSIQLRDPTLPDQVAGAIARSGFDPAFLELEIAESLFLRDDDPTRAQREKLLAQGVRFCVDDFGTGYSSLAHLARLDVHALKIDRLFVRDLVPGSSTEAIVRAIVAIAQALRLRVMAEGVETEVQRDLLRLVGAEDLQGYLFARPVPAAEATAIMGGAPPRHLSSVSLTAVH